MESCVLKILVEYLAWARLKEQRNYDNLLQKEKDELRLENDNDVKYYYEIMGLTKEEALCADTIISFWTPYSRLLEIEAGWTAYKTTKSLESLIKQIKADWNNKYTKPILQVNNNVEDFARMCYTKGNYMLLPKRQMNNQRYRVAEDRIDLTLYECIDKGVLAKFFKTEDTLRDWIDRQKLSSIFIGGKIELNREKINWFITEDKPRWISEMAADEVYKYLEKAMLLIQGRN